MSLNIASEALTVFVIIIDVCNPARPVIYRDVQKGGVGITLKQGLTQLPFKVAA